MINTSSSHWHNRGEISHFEPTFGEYPRRHVKGDLLLLLVLQSDFHLIGSTFRHPEVFEIHTNNMLSGRDGDE